MEVLAFSLRLCVFAREKIYRFFVGLGEGLGEGFTTASGWILSW